MPQMFPILWWWMFVSISGLIFSVVCFVHFETCGVEAALDSPCSALRIGSSKYIV
nr:ATP synthase F0 subunit 8 [Quadraceps punctatus]